MVSRQNVDKHPVVKALKDAWMDAVRTEAAARKETRAKAKDVRYAARQLGTKRKVYKRLKRADGPNADFQTKTAANDALQDVLEAERNLAAVKEGHKREKRLRKDCRVITRDKKREYYRARDDQRKKLEHERKPGKHHR